MSRHVACLLIFAGLALGIARHASASPVQVTDEKIAGKQFKTVSKDNLASMKTFLKSELATLKGLLKGHADDLKNGTDPFTVAPLVANDIASALEQLSSSLSTHAGLVDSQGSSIIDELDFNTSGAFNFFPGSRHGDGGELDKFVASVNKELVKFMAAIRKELAKLRKAFVKNSGSTQGLKFIFTVHEFPRSFDPTPSNEASGALNGEVLNAFLVGFSLILPGTPDRQDVFVIAISRGDATLNQIDVRFRQGNQANTPIITHNGISQNSNSIYQDSLTNQATTLPIFADGFESGDTSAWSNTVP